MLFIYIIFIKIIGKVEKIYTIEIDANDLKDLENFDI